MAGKPKRRPVSVLKAASGLAEDGTWSPQFAGQRAPFERGHQLAVTHGASVAAVNMGSRPAEIADALRAHVPGYHAGVETIVQLYAVTLVRIERAARALDIVETEFERTGKPPAVSYRKEPDDMLFRLRHDLRSWIGTSLRLADALGLTPASSARILRDAGIGGAAAAQHEVLLERYRGDRG